MSLELIARVEVGELRSKRRRRPGRCSSPCQLGVCAVRAVRPHRAASAGACGRGRGRDDEADPPAAPGRDAPQLETTLRTAIRAASRVLRFRTRHSVHCWARFTGQVHSWMSDTLKARRLSFLNLLSERPFAIQSDADLRKFSLSTLLQDKGRAHFSHCAWVQETSWFCVKTDEGQTKLGERR